MIAASRGTQIGERLLDSLIHRVRSGAVNAGALSANSHYSRGRRTSSGWRPIATLTNTFVVSSWYAILRAPGLRI
jgi:hypothetical protein